MSKNYCSIEYMDWYGMDGIRFSAGGYTAIIIPEKGANVVSLKNENGADILRTPKEDEIELFKETPVVYGLPVLFFPNRIEDGVFQLNDEIYHLEVNEDETNNHCHGWAHTRPWNLIRAEIVLKDEVQIEVQFKATKDSDFYDQFPHEFTINMIYILSKKGLQQLIEVKNLSGREMPVGVCHHTAINTPFMPGGKRDDCTVLMSVDERWELNERMLPTERLLELDEADQKFLDGTHPVGGPAMDDHFTANYIMYHGKPFHGAMIIDNESNKRVVYQTTDDYGHWMIWNCDGDKEFICPEPMSWAVNAPNLKLSKNITGYVVLADQCSWKAAAKIYVE